jgi:hypothetical protein
MGKILDAKERIHVANVQRGLIKWRRLNHYLMNLRDNDPEGLDALTPEDQHRLMEELQERDTRHNPRAEVLAFSRDLDE